MKQPIVKRPSGAKRRDITSLRVIIFIILAAVIFGVLAPILNNSSRKVTFDCLQQTCSTSLVKDLQSSSSNLGQNFDVRLDLQAPSVLPQSVSSVPKESGQNAYSQITWTYVRGGETIVRIPMRYGSDPSFRFQSEKMPNLTSIRVTVVHGRQFYIYLNGQVAYTHRYQLPVFYSDPIELIQSADAASGYISSVTVMKSSIYRERIALNRLASLTFGLFGVFLSFLICILLLKKFGRPTRNVTKMGKVRVGTLMTLWIVSIVAWAMAPVDPTGANNPGLFGPLGPALSDYFQISQVSHLPHPYNLGAVNYPPFSLAALKVLSTLLPGLLGLALIISACFGVLLFMFMQVNRDSNRSSRLRNVLIFLAPYPLIFGIVRGNIDLLAIALIWLAVLFKDSKYAIWPAILLGCAISLKVWPVVFLVFFFRWQKKKVASFAAGLALIFTAASSIFLGYRSISQILHVASLSFSSSSAVSADAYHYTYSLSSLLYFGHIFLLGKSPTHPTQQDLANGLAFANSAEAKIGIALLIILLVGLIWKTQTISRSYLYCSGLALLISTPTFTYRGVILVAYFYLYSVESQAIQEGKTNKNRPISPERTVKDTVWVNRLKEARSLVWLPLLAPTTILFFGHNYGDDQVSLASLLQPLSLIALLGIEAYLSRLKVDS